MTESAAPLSAETQMALLAQNLKIFSERLTELCISVKNGNDQNTIILQNLAVLTSDARRSDDYQRACDNERRAHDIKITQHEAALKEIETRRIDDAKTFQDVVTRVGSLEESRARATGYFLAASSIGGCVAFVADHTLKFLGK
jgi:hypothetical protein